VVIFAVESEDYLTVGVQITASVGAAVPVVVEKVLSLLEGEAAPVA